MSKAWRWHQTAFDEARQAAEWYERRRPGLGDDFLAELDDKLALLEQAPLIASALPHSLEARPLLLDRFPYGLIFTELPGEYLIVAVAHLRREPSYWLGRLVNDD